MQRRRRHRRTPGAEEAAQGEHGPSSGAGDLTKSSRLLRQGGRDPVSAYKLIDAAKASVPVAVLCKVLSVSHSGYCAWRDRPPTRMSQQDATLTATIYE